ncbi:MAG TPA: hypothetical protein VFM18_10475 [Methanosarcina sp.]|nr:hypothetical protein [Methanosarcina sp.]
MKKAFTIFAVVASLFALSETAFGSQNLLAFIAKNFTGGGAALLNVDATGNLLESNGALATNNISGASAVVAAGVHRMVTVNVLAASGTGAIYDSATVASAVAANKVYTIPATAGSYTIDWPMASGIVVDPSGSTLSVKYN